MQPLVSVCSWVATNSGRVFRKTELSSLKERDQSLSACNADCGSLVHEMANIIEEEVERRRTLGSLYDTKFSPIVIYLSAWICDFRPHAFNQQTLRAAIRSDVDNTSDPTMIPACLP